MSDLCDCINHLPRGSHHSLVPSTSSTVLSVCTLCSPSPNPTPSYSDLKNVNASIFMSSAGPTSPTSDLQLIIDAAFADYTKITGTDLSETPFAAAIQQSNSPELVLQLLHERQKTYKEYRDGDRKLINCLSPIVKIVQALSGIQGEAVNHVSSSFHAVTLLTGTSSDPTPTGKRFVCCY